MNFSRTYAPRENQRQTSTAASGGHFNRKSRTTKHYEQWENSLVKCTTTEKVWFVQSITVQFPLNETQRLSYVTQTENSLRASAWETGADLEMKVSRFCSNSVHKVVVWTYVLCQSSSFNDLFPAEFWISAPKGSSKADFQCNFGHFSISPLAMYN